MLPLPPVRTVGNRTPREIARANGAKVPPLPALNGYCTMIGYPGVCQHPKDNASAASAGGNASMPRPMAPFKLGG